MADEKTGDGDIRERLTPEQYEITQNKGTERAFTGKYVDHKADGTYRCACCEAELFSSEHKFDSGTGWPSGLVVSCVMFGRLRSAGLVGQG